MQAVVPTLSGLFGTCLFEMANLPTGWTRNVQRHGRSVRERRNSAGPGRHARAGRETDAAFVPQASGRRGPTARSRRRERNSALFGTVLDAIETSGQGIGLKLEAKEERRDADMKPMEKRSLLAKRIMEERLKGETGVVKRGIGLPLAFAIRLSP